MPPSVPPLVRKAITAGLVSLAVGAGLAVGQGSASAGEGVVAPDWGVTCLNDMPYKNAAYSYRLASPAVHIVNGYANCRYTRISAGSSSAGLFAGYRTIEQYVDWDTACQLSYGPSSQAGGQICSLPDGGDYYVNTATPAATARARG